MFINLVPKKYKIISYINIIAMQINAFFTNKINKSLLILIPFNNLKTTINIILINVTTKMLKKNIYTPFDIKIYIMPYNNPLTPKILIKDEIINPMLNPL